MLFNHSRDLLLIPRGGLNDILCQLTRCFLYAQKENRNLIIDTKPSGLRLPLEVIFERKDWVPIFFIDHKNYLKNMTGSIFPQIPISPNGEIQFEYSQDWANYISPDLSKPITFNHNESYTEDTLIHLQCGGGDWGHHWFKCVNFKETFLEKITAKISTLPAEYDGVHVRNTDMKTDYKRFFSDIADDVIGKKLLVCSDNDEVITYAKNNLPADDMITISDIPTNGEVPLHDRDDYNNEELYTNALNTFIDLFSLALSKNLHISKNVSGGFSGFSILAINLFKNKEILREILSPSNSIS